MSNILSHKNLSSATKTRAIVNWTGIWFVIMGNFRAQTSADDSPANLIVDCAGINQQLRRSSQRSLKDFLKRINDSIDYHLKDRYITANQSQKIKGFFPATAASSKLINSLKGRRHFTLGLDCIETLAWLAFRKTQRSHLRSLFMNGYIKECFLLLTESLPRLQACLNPWMLLF
jgi:hypothetical protein